MTNRRRRGPGQREAEREQPELQQPVDRYTRTGSLVIRAADRSFEQRVERRQSEATQERRTPAIERKPSLRRWQVPSRSGD
jgi:hypothetical protein